jgi:GT2 family glycosyltransferase
MSCDVERLRVGAVVIGRNEAKRLAHCLRSLSGRVEHIVYVDSASMDRSVEVAAEHGVQVISLDTSFPLSAARARNEGARALRVARPELDLVFFIDGDCELIPGFLEPAVETMASEGDIAVVCGRRRERRPDASVYNRLCEMEWAGPAGDVDWCGGDSVMRLAAFDEVGGFDPSLIAGEEPDLCLRLRRRGHRVHRLAQDMTLHDAAITRFSEWWRRAERAGHAFTEGAIKHRHGGERYWVREAMRPWVFGAVVPVSALVGLVPTFGLSAGILLAYPLSGIRAYGSFKNRGFSSREAAIAATYCVLGRFPELLGSARFVGARLRGRARSLIEYKGARS